MNLKPLKSPQTACKPFVAQAALVGRAASHRVPSVQRPPRLGPHHSLADMQEHDADPRLQCHLLFRSMFSP